MVVRDLNDDSIGMIEYGTCPRMNGMYSNAEVGSVIGTGCYLSESTPILHRKDQSVNVQVHSRCLLQSPNETRYSNAGTPLKNRMHTYTHTHNHTRTLEQKYIEANRKD